MPTSSPPGVDKCAARVARVHGRVGLDERFDAEFARNDIEPARLGTDDTCRDGRLQVERRADGKHPLAEAQRVGTAERQRRQILRLDLNQRNVGCGVATDDFGVERATVVEFHTQFGGVLDHMVVGYDIAVLGENHSRTARTLFALLRRTLLAVALRDAEELEERVETAPAAADLDLLNGFDIDDRLHGILRRVCQVGIRLRSI